MELDLSEAIIDFPTAWAIQGEGGLAHAARCSSVPGWHPLSGPSLLCDCGAVVDEWNRRQVAEWPPWQLRAPAGRALLLALDDSGRTVRDLAAAAFVGENHARELLNLAVRSGYATSHVDSTPHGRPPTLYARTGKPLPPDEAWRTHARSDR